MSLLIREFIWVYSFIFSIFKVRMIGWFLFKVNCEDYYVFCMFELFKMFFYFFDFYLFIIYVFFRVVLFVKVDLKNFKFSWIRNIKVVLIYIYIFWILSFIWLNYRCVECSDCIKEVGKWTVTIITDGTDLIL